MHRIHPTAIIDPAARLADDVRVGPYAIIDGPVALGPGCVIGPHCHLIGPMTLGAGNTLHAGAVLGDEPQHLAASGDGADVIIGDGNTFREYATVHRGSGPGKATRIGNNNYFMSAAHVGHDAVVGNRCILANSALLAGHVELADSVFLSGNTAVHQRNRVGRLCLLGGGSAITKDMPPFLIIRDYNHVYGLNIIGMRRAGFTNAQIDAARAAFRILYTQGNLLGTAVEKLERELGGIDVVREIIDFIQKSPHGIATTRGRSERRAA